MPMRCQDVLSQGATLRWQAPAAPSPAHRRVGPDLPELCHSSTAAAPYADCPVPFPSASLAREQNRSSPPHPAAPPQATPMQDPTQGQRSHPLEKDPNAPLSREQREILALPPR